MKIKIEGLETIYKPKINFGRGWVTHEDEFKNLNERADDFYKDRCYWREVDRERSMEQFRPDFND